MTVAMLLMQMLCPGLVFGCSCQHSPSGNADDGQECFCSGDQSPLTAGSCPHCTPLLGASGRHDSNTPADGFQQDSMCHCGDFTPVLPSEQSVPDSAEVQLKHALNLLVSIDGCLTIRVIPVPAPALPPMPSSKELTQHYRQVVLCVWLT